MTKLKKGNDSTYYTTAVGSFSNPGSFSNLVYVYKIEFNLTSSQATVT
jgi:hypothetical protein